MFLTTARPSSQPSAMDSENDTCHTRTSISPSESPLISAIMFALGILGNVAALVILEFRRCRSTRSGDARRRALFHVLITALVLTDLAGTCFVSPLVQLSYARNQTLVGMSQQVCSYFGMSMTFFSLATLSLLFSMALERCVAIGYPYLYSRHVTKKCAYVAIPVVFLLCTLFSLLPLAGFGKYVQYCPGTWCFIDMNPTGREDRAYSNLYATIMLLLVLAIVACNGFVVYQLFKMFQRRRRNGSVMASVRSNSERRVTSMAEEVEHLILLVFMTIIFIICTMPLVIRVYRNSIGGGDDHHADLDALRYISINSIIDPWVFILLSPSVLHFFWTSLCRARLGITARGSIFKSSLAKQSCQRASVELCPTTMTTKTTELFHSTDTL